MKKSYMTPGIAFQSLNITVNSNGSCEYIYKSETAPATDTACLLWDKKGEYFVFGEACLELGGIPMTSVEPCYAHPSENFNVQNS